MRAPLARFERTLRPGGAAVLHVGHGTIAWPGIVSEGPRTWWCLDDEVLVFDWVDPVHALVHDGTLRAWLGPRAREVHATRKGWVEHARYRPVPGPERLWTAGGFLYRRDEQRVHVVDVAREHWMSGPEGALLGGSGGWAEVGATGGLTPRPLPVAMVWESVRFDANGVTGLSEDEEWFHIDLRTMVARATEDPSPPSFSPARWEHWLAGPGGVVWSLADGKRQFESPRLSLGLTVGTPDGFVTMDWETNEASLVGFDGSRRWHTPLPIDPDDTVVAGAWADGVVHVQTALGMGLHLRAGVASEGPVAPERPEPGVLDLGSAGQMSVAGATMVGAHHFGWTEDGWLVAVPEGYSAIS